MSRLTNHFDYCELFECKGYDEEFAKENMCKYLNTSRDKCLDRSIYNKLVEYEDLEEQGLLLKLPCKIGDYIYVLEDVYGKGEIEITEYRVECMRTGDNTSLTFDALEHDECLEVTFETMDIGRTVFLSYAEAEKALKRLEGAE